MAPDQIIQYLRENSGYPREQLREQLLSAGYPEPDIAAAEAQLDAGAVTAPPPVSLNSKLPGTIALVKEAWALFISHWRPYLGISLVWFVSILGMPFLISATGARAYDVGLSVVVIGFLLLIFLQLWGSAALWYAIARGSGPITIKESFSGSLRLILPLIWLNILMMGIVIGGYVLLIVPGIIFSVWFVFASYVLFVDGDRGMSALFKSREYIRGYVVPVFGRLILFGLVGFVALSALGILISLLSSKMGDTSGWAYIIIANAFDSAWIIFTLIYSFVLFFHVRARKGVIKVDTSKGRKAKYAALAVLGVLGGAAVPILLAGIILSGLGAAVDSSADARRLADLDAVRLALEVYAQQNNGVYPGVADDPGQGPNAASFVAMATELVDQNLLSSIPTDPTQGRSYVAQMNDPNNPTTYILGADLESSNLACDSDYDGSDLEDPDVVPIAVCGENVANDCGGDEPDGVDYCICVGLGCS